MSPEVGIAQIKTFFSHGASRPVETSEMMQFWKSCSDEDKAAFKTSVGNWNGQSFYC